MTPLEMIAEWRKGCTIAGPMHSRCYPDGEPIKTGYCVECTEALIDALESALKREGLADALKPFAEMGEVILSEAPSETAAVDLWVDSTGKKYRFGVGQLRAAVAAMTADTPPRATDCPSSPDGRHQLDTSMESGPNNCFHCDAPMGKPSRCPDLDSERGRGLA